VNKFSQHCVNSHHFRFKIRSELESFILLGKLLGEWQIFCELSLVNMTLEQLPGVDRPP